MALMHEKLNLLVATRSIWDRYMVTINSSFSKNWTFSPTEKSVSFNESERTENTNVSISNSCRGNDAALYIFPETISASVNVELPQTIFLIFLMCHVLCGAIAINCTESPVQYDSPGFLRMRLSCPAVTYALNVSVLCAYGTTIL